MNPFSRALTLVVAVVIVLAFHPTATAQQMARVVVLDIGPSTQRLESALAEIPDVEIRGQAWFVEQIRDAGYEPRKIFERPGDLRFVMAGAGVDWVVALRVEGEMWFGALFDTSGEASVEFELQRSSDELTAEDVQSVRRYLATELGTDVDDASSTSVADKPDGEEVRSRDAAPAEPGTPATPAEEEVPSTRVVDVAAPVLRATVSGALLKRDVTYAGTNAAVLTFRSAFYPGARFEVGYFGIADRRVGIAAAGVVGFDEIRGESESISVLHLEGDLAVSARIADHLRVAAGARHARFDLSENAVLPSTSVTLARVGLRFDGGVGPVSVAGAADAYPFGFVGGVELFGESALAYGFGGSLAVGYALSDAFGISAGCDFRTVRTDFTGSGTLDFRGARAFELVWGPHVGITFAQ